MPESQTQTCPVCKAQIVGNDKVIFSVGAPGTRSKLWARVCQYTNNRACINQDTDAMGDIKKTDYYKPDPPEKK